MGRGSNDLSLQVVLSAQDKASGALRGFGSTLVNLAGDAGPLLSSMLAISAAAIAIGVASVDAAAKYQQQMNMVQGLTGSTSAQMAQYDTQLKQLAMDAGVAPDKLASGLYNVLSAGYAGADAMKVLTLATEDAKIGLTSSAVTSNALTVALKAFNVPAKDFVAVNGEMLRTVTAGKMTMSDYSSAISKTSSVAVQYKDTMSDMNAVLATLTSSGIKNANVAGTDYNNLLKVLNGNTKAVADASHKLNPNFDENAFAAMNVHDKVMYLNQMIVSHGHNITDVIGKQQNAAAAFTMLSTHADTYSANLKNLSDHQANAKATQDAWAITQSGFTQQMDKAGASVQVLFIDIGQNLLPVLTKIVGAVAPAVQWLISFATAVSKNQVAMAFLGGALVGFVALVLMLVVPAFIAWAIAAGAAALATLAATWPFILVAIIIAVVVAAIILAIQHWGAIVDWLKGVWGAIVGFFQMIWNGILAGLHAVGQFFATVWGDIVSGVGGFFSGIGTRIHIGMEMVRILFIAMWVRITQGIQEAWTNIVDGVKAGLKWLWDAFTLPFRQIGQLFEWLYEHNTYFQRLVDKIHEIILAGLAKVHELWQGAIDKITQLWDNLKGIAGKAWNAVKDAVVEKVLALGTWEIQQWNKATSWLSDKWNGLKGIVSKAWEAVKSAVMDKVLALGTWEIDQWNKASQWLSDKWNGFKDLMGNAWKAVSGVLSSAWSTYITGPLGNLWNSIVGFANGWPKQALEWGQNLIKGFIQGIQNMAGQAGQAAQDIMKNVASFLGFHSPAEKGEGQHIIEWGANMLKGFSGGVVAAIPTLQAAVNMAVSTGTRSLSPAGLASGGSMPYGQPPISSNSYSNSSGGNHYYGPVTVVAQGADAKQVAVEVSKLQDFKYRRSGVITPMTSGGKSGV